MLLQKSGKENPDLALLQKEGAALLDVRTHEEFVGRHMKGALNIPVDELENRMETILKWGIPLLVYSGEDDRSAMATRKLRLHGVDAYDVGTFTMLKKPFKDFGWSQPPLS